MLLGPLSRGQKASHSSARNRAQKPVIAVIAVIVVISVIAVTVVIPVIAVTVVIAIIASIHVIALLLPDRCCFGCKLSQEQRPRAPERMVY